MRTLLPAKHRNYLHALMTPLILLHGALGAASETALLAEALKNSREILALSLPGHGGRPLPDTPFSMDLFADDVLAEMDERGIGSADFFGYSMGGYVAAVIARRAPERVRRIATLGTKWHWDAATAAREAMKLDPATMQAKVPGFVAALAAMHAPTDWQSLVTRTAALLTGLGAAPPLRADDFSAINGPVLVARGDGDKMVTLEETVATFQALPAGQLAILPATPHPFPGAPLAVLVPMLERFFAAD